MVNKEEKNTYVVVQVENTPFRVVETEKGHVITVGNQLCSQETYETAEKAIERIEKTDWELICSTIYTYMESYKNNK